MIPPLFISSNAPFVTRIRGEAGNSALVTASVIQGLRWISNPDVGISAIYLDPNDSTFSCLRFLELALIQRPSTPIFLIDSEKEILPEHFHHFLNLGRIQGIFSTQASYVDYLAPLQLESHTGLSEIQKRSATKSPYPGYIALPLADFIHLKKYLCDTFIENAQNEVHLFAESGTDVDQEYLVHVSQKTPRLFVSDASIQKMRETLKATQVSFMHLDFFPVSWKMGETLANARNVLNEMRKGGLSDTLVEHTHFLLSDVFSLVSTLEKNSKLTRFVEQARQCDRTMACATLSILMCKTLKFEKSAIVEILGLASLFQDISLYHSPYGNLTDVKVAELSEPATAYYLHHPLLSADLVAQSTSIPDVTLQVMRQHHERKDRTGFPNRIGGMQLHPMAEILSLINVYLDRLDNPETMHELLESDCSHYSDRVAQAFRAIIQLLGHQKTVAPTMVA
jgi:hypothetical protein